MQRNKKNQHTAMKTQCSQNKNKNKNNLPRIPTTLRKAAPLAKMAYKGLAGLCLFLTSCHATFSMFRRHCFTASSGNILSHLRAFAPSVPLPKVFFSHPINLSSYYRDATHPLPQFLFFSLLFVFILLNGGYLVDSALSTTHSLL